MPRKKVEAMPTTTTEPPNTGDVQRAVSQELFVESFVNEMERIMTAENITQAELARRLGQTPSNITQVLRYGGNLSASTMANIALGLGCRLVVRFKPIR
jgi:hypothetical protein